MGTDLKSIKLLDQILEFEKWIDKQQREAAVLNNKSSQAIGESWTVHHLASLRELIIQEHAESDYNRSEKEKK
ncbi:hypothetical protein CMI37_05445 [Candidatus Pacearchaeota archaeon]|jgi:hypothetical protein|nr:hypothetical protein [Candidatus Pacearchaeota archaeon]|tara:strand:- start:1542 stop:1760 length:219 start_codon:yes stop_codon:yes gene_type:complete